jgi:hypothetical protein
MWYSLTSPTLAFVESGLNLWSARPTEIVCVCAAAELVELDSLAVLAEVVGLSLLRPSLSCAMHIEGRMTESKNRTKDTEVRRNIVSVAEVMSAVSALEKIAVIQVGQ